MRRTGPAAAQLKRTAAITLALIVLYVAVQIAIAVWAGRGAKSDADYLVAGRSLGTFAVGMSLFATWFATESLIATSSEVAGQGLAGARAEPFAYAAGLLAVGLFVARRLRAGGFITIADFLRMRFGPGTESLAAVVIAMAATIWSAAQLYAFAVIIAAASPLSFEAALVGATLLVMTYTLFGGLAGDVVTDIVQGAIMVAAMALLFWLVMDASGGFDSALDAVPPEAWRLTAPGESWAERIELWLIPVIGTLVSQEALSRTLAARSPAVARRGALLGAGIYLAVGLVPVCFGLFGPQLAPVLGVTLGEGEAFLPSLAEALFPPWLMIVFTGALVSAILSSVDSALLAVSAVATESGYRRIDPEAGTRTLLRAARAATVLAALVAALVAAAGDSLRDLVMSAEAISAVLAVPIVMGLAGQGHGTRAGLAAIVVQIAVLAVFDWWLAMPGAFLWMLAAGLASFAAVALIERAAAGEPLAASPRGISE